MHEILERALKQCEAAEVFCVKTLRTPVVFENNRLKSIDRSEQSGVALRVIKDGRLGFSYSTRPGDALRLVDAALATARYGSPATCAFPGSAAFAAVNNYDPAVPKMSVDALVDTGERFVEDMRQAHPKLLAGIQLDKSCKEVAIVNSAGLNATHKSTSYSAMASVQVATGDDLLFSIDGAGSSSADIDVPAIAQRMTSMVRDGVKTSRLPSGKYPVLMTPLAMRDMMSRVMACVDGRAVERGISPWKDRLGSQVADARFQLYDDQTVATAPASSPFDDEGSPKRRLPIVEDGILRNFLLDLRTAARLGKMPTGNGNRTSVETPPAISPSTLVIGPGQVMLAELIKSIKRGVIVNNMLGAWTGNLYGGDVNGNIAPGYVVENGEVVGRIKDAMFSANAFLALSQRIVGISKEQIDYGFAVSPYILFDGISIVTKG